MLDVVDMNATGALAKCMLGKDEVDMMEKLGEKPAIRTVGGQLGNAEGIADSEMATVAANH